MKKPAFIIAATRSGAGKTTITLGIMSALVKRGYNVQPYKCGPDFIDPTLHSSVTGKNSYNLDLNMMGSKCCRETFYEKGSDADILMLEGVMGLFDGGDSSTAALARTLNVPVFLIIDAQSSAESAAAVLKGFEVFDPLVKIQGVIFNRIGSSRHRELIDNSVRMSSKVPVIGYMPRETDFRIPERHLGLHMGSEQPLDEQSLKKLTEFCESHLDLDSMLANASHDCPESMKTVSAVSSSRKKMRIGVARDEAFCFCYKQNLEMLEQEGLEIVPFSPLHDKLLPEDIQMLYFCGGYPELFGAALSLNQTMIASIKHRYSSEMPIYAECGGFMYLCSSLVDSDTTEHPMVGIFPFRTIMDKRLRRLGYRRVTLRNDCLLGRKGDLLYGHEFHYSDILPVDYSANNSKEIEYLYLLDNSSHEGYSIGSALGSYVHLHFGNTRTALQNMVDTLNFQ